MRLSNSFRLLDDLRHAFSIAIMPTLREVTRKPSLLLHPIELSRVFMQHVWTFYGKAINENCREIKNALIPENARGVVLDIGAGHGHTADYLDPAKVTKYVALEPNTHMHEEIRKAAAAAGFTEEAGSLLILPYGAEHTSLISSALGGPHAVDTMIAILTLCSVPALETTLPALVDQVLKPGGRFVYFEHVLHKRPDVAWWQRFWTPIWGLGYDGCRLDQPTDTIISEMDVWETKEITGLDGEEEETMFIHSIGKLTKASALSG